MKQLLTLFIMASLALPVWADPRDTMPGSPDAIYQNDLDLRDMINNRVGVDGDNICLDNPTLCVDANTNTVKVTGDLNVTGDIDSNASITVASGTVTGAFDVQGQLIGDGTATNDAAASGVIGEYMEDIVSTLTNFTTTGQYKDFGSLTLTAGDWDVTFILLPYFNNATWTGAIMGIGTVTGNDSTGLVFGSNALNVAWASGITPEVVPITVANYRVSVSGTTSYFAKVRANYSLGSPQYRGRFSARRVR